MRARFSEGVRSELPLPILFALPDFGVYSKSVLISMLEGAAKWRHARGPRIRTEQPLGHRIGLDARLLGGCRLQRGDEGAQIAAVCIAPQRHMSGAPMRTSTLISTVLLAACANPQPQPAQGQHA